MEQLRLNEIGITVDLVTQLTLGRRQAKQLALPQATLALSEQSLNHLAEGGKCLFNEVLRELRFTRVPRKYHAVWLCGNLAIDQYLRRLCQSLRDVIVGVFACAIFLPRVLVKTIGINATSPR